MRKKNPNQDSFSLSDLKINFKYKNEKQKELFKIIKENRITFVRGVAGSGKTIIALHSGLKLLKQSTNTLSKILLIKPPVETGKSIGYIPGDFGDKIYRYFEPFYDNISKIMGSEEITHELKKAKLIKDQIINFVRGTTFGEYKDGKPIGHFIIADEMQNTTIHEMKTFISRLGENSKMVIMGDTDQMDIKLRNEKNGLDDAWDRFQGMDDVGFIEFTEEDIVRDKFLIDIMKRYKENI